jgi:alpha-mannosidase
MTTMRRAFAGVLAIFLAAAAGFPQAGSPAAKPRDFTASLVGHAHIDLSWLWRWEETVHDIAVQTFAGTLERMAKMPGLTFAQSQAAIYEAVEKTRPDLFAAIKARVREGTWIPVGGMWVEPDLNMPDGEALARQLLYGKRYFLDKFGRDVTVGWNPDSFGHNAQLPQILAKAGITSYIFERCAPEKTTLFWWQGKDGSKVLAYVPPGWYVVSLKDGVRDLILETAKTSPLRDYLLLYGEGDHGGGPRDSDLEAIRKFRKDKTQPRLEFASPERYFEALRKLPLEIPTVAEELNFTFPACYTTQAEAKKGNRRGESLLVSAEKFSALAASLGFRDYYPERDLDEAWKIVLRNQFHDILDGSSIGPVYDDVRRDYEAAFARGRRALDFSLETIGNAVDTRGEGVPLLVYNPLSWDRTEPVTCEIPLSGPFRIVDARGAEAPAQVVARDAGPRKNLRRVVFIAEAVPSLGYKLFRIVPADQEPVFAPAATAGPDGLENEYFKVVLDPKTGWITRLYDKVRGREALQRPGNFLQAIVDEPESMSAWELGLKDTSWNVGEDGASVEVVETGPVRAVVRVRSSFRRSVFVQDMALYARLPRLDVGMRLDWQERNLMIKAVFPVDIRADRAEFEIPFGSVTRPGNGAEVPMIRWADVSENDGSYGVCLLNDGKYGIDVRGSIARLSVIHGPVYPDPEADRGPHELAYALYPHAGTWKEAGTLRRGYEFGNPLLVRTVMAHPGRLPAEMSFFRTDAPNVVLSAFKKEMGYYSRGYILRLYEAFGQRTDVNVELPWPAETAEADLIERPGRKVAASGKTLTLSFSPFEIKTLRLVRK